MKIYGSQMSPFVQRVIITCRVKDIAFELVPPPGGLVSSEFREFSPTHRIPVIVEDDGWKMVESLAIIQYLDATRPGPSLVPANPRDAAKARAIASVCDSEIGPAVRQYTRQRLLKRYHRPDVLLFAGELLDYGLDSIERIGVDSGRWMLGDEISIADVALMTLMALGQAVVELSEGGNILSGRPGIDAWWARAQTDPLGAEMMDVFRKGYGDLVRVHQAAPAGAA